MKKSNVDVSIALSSKKEGKKRRLESIKKGIKRDWQLILIGLPAIIILFLFSYLPMTGVLYSFQKVGLRNSFWDNKWVGIRWFREFFSSIYAGRVIKNTLILNFWSLLAGTTAEICLALIFNEVKNGKFKRFAQSCTYFPNFISTTVVVGMMVTMLNPQSGILSKLIQDVFGMGEIDLFVQPSMFRPLYIISGMWQGVGWGSIIYMGAITNIDQSLYEAASIDGCGRIKRIWYITLPGIKSVIVICLIMHIGSMMNMGASKILLMYSSAIYETSDVISTFVYRQGLASFNYGYGSAIGLFNSITNLILLLSANYAAKKLTGESML